MIELICGHIQKGGIKFSETCENTADIKTICSEYGVEVRDEIYNDDKIIDWRIYIDTDILKTKLEKKFGFNLPSLEGHNHASMTRNGRLVPRGKITNIELYTSAKSLTLSDFSKKELNIAFSDFILKNKILTEIPKRRNSPNKNISENNLNEKCKQYGSIATRKSGTAYNDGSVVIMNDDDFAYYLYETGVITQEEYENKYLYFKS